MKGTVLLIAAASVAISAARVTSMAEDATGGSGPPAAPALPERRPVPQDFHGAAGKSYVVYVEAMPGDTLDDKIRNAMNRALSGGGAAEIVLPHGHLEITQPIRFWRQRRTSKVNTTADAAELGDIRSVWAAMKGAAKQDLARGIVLRGISAQATRLTWKGAPNQVVIDIPAPYHVEVRNFAIDGNNTPGLTGIRYRAGWEFGVNGGKKNLFEQISLIRIDVGIHVGGPFGPDLVGSLFRQISVVAARIGFLLEGANVAEMWFQQCFLGTCEEAGFKMISHQGRVLRSVKEQDSPTDESVVRDAFGREIFLEQLPPFLAKKKVRRGAHADVPGSEQRAWAGGGGPSSFISDLNAHMSDPRAWMIDSNWASVRLEHVRKEGCSGVLRVSGKHGGIRFNDMLLDVNATSTGGPNGYAIEYHKAGNLYILGGTFEGPIGLGEGTVCYSMGTRFLNRQRVMSGYLPKGAPLDPDGFYAKTGEERIVPHRRWAGEIVRSGAHKRIGFEPLPGTAGGRLLELREGHEGSVPVPRGATSVAVNLAGLQRQPDTAYRLAVTPGWRAGSVWVETRRQDGFTVRFDDGPADGEGRLDFILTRGPMRGVQE